MNDSNFLTKDEARGRRKTNNRTFHRTSHQFDDEKDVKGGRRGHTTRHVEFSDETIYDEDDDYADLIDWKKIK